MNQEKNQKKFENWLSSKVENTDKIKQSAELKEKLNNWLKTKSKK